MQKIATIGMYMGIVMSLGAMENGNEYLDLNEFGLNGLDLDTLLANALDFNALNVKAPDTNDNSNSNKLYEGENFNVRPFSPIDRITKEKTEQENFEEHVESVKNIVEAYWQNAHTEHQIQAPKEIKHIIDLTSGSDSDNNEIEELDGGSPYAIDATLESYREQLNRLQGDNNFESRKEIIREMIERFNVNPNHISIGGHSVLYDAVTTPITTKCMIFTNRMDKKDSKKKQPEYLAAVCSDYEFIKYLFSKGVLIDAETKQLKKSEQMENQLKLFAQKKTSQTAKKREKKRKLVFKNIAYAFNTNP